MQIHNHLSINKKHPISLYSSKQLYAMEQAWFDEGHDSFGLMQQAAWQMAKHIEQLYEKKYLNRQSLTSVNFSHRHNHQYRVSIWVGKGNNGGDGWLISYYLKQAGWQVQIVTVGFEDSDFNYSDSDQVNSDKSDTTAISNSKSSIKDAQKALQIARSANCNYERFEDSQNDLRSTALQADVYIDALFGIGLDRTPYGIYKQAIGAFNELVDQNNGLAIAVDIPSGVVASTGEVFDRIAIQADETLCLIARKFGLHTKDGVDYSGQVTDIPLIPYQVGNVEFEPVAKLITAGQDLRPRRQNSYKGSYGHVLVIGGNRVDGSQGMGGAAILSASSSMAAGAGKITVACHEAFHNALLTSLPDAMTINLHDTQGVQHLIKAASVVAIGMGLGRDNKAQALFVNYIQTAMTAEKPIVVDADGLYHLASLQRQSHTLIAQLREYSINNEVFLTPHSGEAAKLLDKKIQEIESDRLSAIKLCAQTYGGNWVLKGAGSLVLESDIDQEQVYVCGVGNAGMATAGMGDVLSGVIAGLLAQQDLASEMRSLHQAVVIHALAGDILVSQTNQYNSDHGNLLIGQRGLQAQDMPVAIRHVMQLMMNTYN
ncbi:NAD(P)H-hydrate dehydratase [Psychrobacter sp. NG25]|uniref:NAD(P)H-hydrate dehydratase n=1 Tax=Psychrobacter sp. NG25 TaxID=2782005 RepID=UPI0018837FCD|nr:NAD(P)H-hydrate dehydratase [Psychrobacter sp. NG25]MBF0659545.1 NAD(P)H-hydrate dehydratase [Psychrobacter sp. NG25]